MTMSQGFGAQKVGASTDGVTGTQREPSMEEILASIRRIIEDNDTPAARAAAPQRSPETVTPAALQPSNSSDAPATQPARTREPDEPVRQQPAAAEVRKPSWELPRLEDEKPLGLRGELGAAGAAPAQKPVAAPAPKASPAPSFATKPTPVEAEFRSQPAPKPAETAPALREAPAHGEGDESKVVGGILSAYTGRKVAAAFGELNEAFEASRRRSFDQVAEEMLRPMLQDWLDNNLPTLVERLVREEIERIARGA